MLFSRRTILLARRTRLLVLLLLRLLRLLTLLRLLGCLRLVARWLGHLHLLLLRLVASLRRGRLATLVAALLVGAVAIAIAAIAAVLAAIAIACIATITALSATLAAIIAVATRGVVLTRALLLRRFRRCGRASTPPKMRFNQPTTPVTGAGSGSATTGAGAGAAATGAGASSRTGAGWLGLIEVTAGATGIFNCAFVSACTGNLRGVPR